jgi:hypothetical protein
MTTAMARQSLTGFVTDQRPAAIALTGPWGSGKTWMWNSVIRALAAETEQPFKRYAYVSLFGLDSMAELKAALFENAVPPGHVGGGATTATWREEMSGVLEAGSVSEGAKRSGLIAYWKARKHAKLVASLLPGWGAAVRSATFLSVRDYVVCLDDIERKGAGLSMTEILGLVSQLTEQRNCRVVIILNEEGFGPEGKAEKDRFNGFREKVLDREVVFNPTVSECADLVFKGKSELHGLASIYAEDLGIINIRILQRLARALDDFIPHLDNARRTVETSLVKSATLLVWCYYGKAAGAPDFAFVRNIAVTQFADVGDVDKLPQSEQAWMATLSGYAYNPHHVLDDIVCDYLERGYIDTQRLGAALAEANAQADAEAASGSMRDAWNLLHHSFADNTAGFTATLASSATANAQWLRYLEAEAACFILRKLGEAGKANEFAAIWVETNAAIDPNRLTVPEDVFSVGVQDASFRAMAAAAAIRPPVPTLGETIKDRAGSNGWNPIDEEVLSTATVDDYVAFFRHAGPDERMGSYVEFCLRFGRFSPPTPPQARIAQTASDALRVLAAESPINAQRVSRFALYTAPPVTVTIPPPNPFTPTA